ncbi:thioredoxin family protein, partial [Pseudomonas coronafaciens]|uniref:thioredoxin family protein n=1 Tax=Pseudomonas coronafaciens TaxID=53409 RepID=UPI001F1CE81B
FGHTSSITDWRQLSPKKDLTSCPGSVDHYTWAILDDLAPEFEGRVVMLRVPSGACPTAELNYNLTKAPTVIFFKNGKKIDETVNFHLKFWFRAKINELLGLAE